VEGSEELALEFDAKIVARLQGREGWLREGKRQLEQHRWRQPDPISRSRRERLLLAAGRLEADVEVEPRANKAYQHYRATARDRLGRRVAGRPGQYRPPELPAGKVNVTDPDLRSIPLGFGFVQGYNVQPAVNERQLVVAAEITNARPTSRSSTHGHRYAGQSASGPGSASCARRSPPTPATGTSSA